jgi:ABC-type multidrug transport system permease subunit
MSALVGEVLWDAGMLFGALVWLTAMFRRRRTDLEEYRTSQDSTARRSIVATWIVTAVVALWLVAFLVTIARRFL